MNKLLLIALALSLPFVQAMRADDQKKKDSDSQNQFDQAMHKVEAARAEHSGRAVPRHAAPVQQNQHAAVVHRNVQNRSVQSTTQANDARFRNRAVERDHSQQVVAHPNYHHGHHRNYNRNSFSVARGHVIHEHHNRDWWRHHYHNTRFVLFGGGYYYLNDGYWYPAYGYSPIYNDYSYSEPIYSYNDLAPGQVLENVQLALRDMGYYHGAIDGLIGPETRGALAAFQRDHGLVETAAVDEPTLVELGLG
jgi:hypothetical protein